MLNWPNSSLGNREDIFITHLIIIIKSEVSTFPVVIFSVVVCLRWLYHHKLSVSIICMSQESWVFCPLLPYSLMMCVNTKIHYDPMAVSVCLHITLPHYHHYVELSESIE